MVRDTQGREFGIWDDLLNRVANMGYAGGLKLLGWASLAVPVGIAGKTVIDSAKPVAMVVYQNLLNNAQFYDSWKKVETTLLATGITLAMGGIAAGARYVYNRGRAYGESAREEASENAEVRKAKKSIDRTVEVAAINADGERAIHDIEMKTSAYKARHAAPRVG